MLATFARWDVSQDFGVKIAAAKPKIMQ